jgi:small subunit ribosomal protein S20
VANIKSQIKRIGTNKKAQDRNKAVKSELKTAVRAAREAIVAGDKDKATASLALASKKLDKAASKGVIHTASRRSRSRSALSEPDPLSPALEGLARCEGPRLDRDGALRVARPWWPSQHQRPTVPRVATVVTIRSSA